MAWSGLSVLSLSGLKFGLDTWGLDTSEWAWSRGLGGRCGDCRYIGGAGRLEFGERGGVF